MGTSAELPLEDRLTAGLATLGISAAALGGADPLDYLLGYCRLLKRRAEVLQADTGSSPIGLISRLFIGCQDRCIPMEDCEAEEALFHEIDRLRAENTALRRSHLRVVS